MSIKNYSLAALALSVTLPLLSYAQYPPLSPGEEDNLARCGYFHCSEVDFSQLPKYDPTIDIKVQKFMCEQALNGFPVKAKYAELDSLNYKLPAKIKVSESSALTIFKDRIEVDSTSKINGVTYEVHTIQTIRPNIGKDSAGNDIQDIDSNVEIKGYSYAPDQFVGPTVKLQLASGVILTYERARIFADSMINFLDMETKRETDKGSEAELSKVISTEMDGYPLNLEEPISKGDGCGLQSRGALRIIERTVKKVK